MVDDPLQDRCEVSALPEDCQNKDQLPGLCPERFHTEVVFCLAVSSMQIDVFLSAYQTPAIYGVCAWQHSCLRSIRRTAAIELDWIKNSRSDKNAF